MTKDYFKELFHYDAEMTRGCIERWHAHPSMVSERSGLLLSHIVQVHQLWNSMILQAIPPSDWWQAMTYDEMIGLLASNTETSLQILEDLSLEAQIDVPNPRGGSVQFAVGDMLFHIINHGTYHRGQINADFRAHDIEPTKTDFIFYKAMQRH